MLHDDLTVALVHGCTQGPSGWDRVCHLLAESDVQNVAVDLDPREFDGTTALECASHITEVLSDYEHMGSSCRARSTRTSTDRVGDRSLSAEQQAGTRRRNPDPQRQPSMRRRCLDRAGDGTNA
jgi:hypothetical protein